MWTYAVKAAVYIRNRCYNPRLKITPYEALTKKVPSLSHMHTFGSECFAYTQKKKKLDPRCEKGIFLGYDSHSPAYLVYYVKEGTIKKVRCVTFNEKFTDKALEEPKEVELHHHCIPKVEKIEENVETIENVQINGNVPERRYPDRDRRMPKHLENFVVKDTAKLSVHYCYKVSPLDTYEEAMESPEVNQWQKSMEKHIDVLVENDTFEETILPDDKSVIGGRWVYTLNEDQYKS